MGRKQHKKEKTKAIALERITILLSRADRIYPEDPALAQRYGELARRIAMKARVRIPRKWRNRYCCKCKKFLYPGIKSHIRIKASTPSRVILYCEECQQGSNVIAF